MQSLQNGRKRKINKTVTVLKTPKTEGSVRKVFLPRTVVYQLIEWKKEQDKLKDVLGSEYLDYNLEMVTTYGLPIGNGAIRKAFKRLIKEHDLPLVVFTAFVIQV